MSRDEQDEAVMNAKQVGFEEGEEINLVEMFGAIMEGPPPARAPLGAIPAGAEDEDEDWEFGGEDILDSLDFGDEGYGSDKDHCI